MTLALMSFSYKLGLPAQADIVLDVRFLKNPYYIPDLQKLSGLDAEIGPYIESDPDFAIFYDHVTALLTTLLPRYLARDQPQFTIAVGCTGGRHRSVYMVQKLSDFLSAQGYKAIISHRDLEKSL